MPPRALKIAPGSLKTVQIWCWYRFVDSFPPIYTCNTKNLKLSDASWVGRTRLLNLDHSMVYNMEVAKSMFQCTQKSVHKKGLHYRLLSFVWCSQDIDMHEQTHIHNHTHTHKHTHAHTHTHTNAHIQTLLKRSKTIGTDLYQRKPNKNIELTLPKTCMNL